MDIPIKRLKHELFRVLSLETPKTTRVSVAMTDDEVAAMRRMCKAFDRSQSQILRAGVILMLWVWDEGYLE